MGENCNCTLGCFVEVPELTRLNILKDFNLMDSVDMQNSYLSGLISVLPIERTQRKEGQEKK